MLAVALQCPAATYAEQVTPLATAKQRILSAAAWYGVTFGRARGYVSKAWTTILRDRDARGRAPLVVTFIDVGQGDAILLQVGDAAILVDAGSHGSWNHGVGAALASLTGPLTALIVTHPHEDHAGGAKSVLDHVRVMSVYTNGERRGPPRDKKRQIFWEDFEAAVTARGLALQTFAVADAIELTRGLEITVLATGGPGGGKFADTNNGSDINNDSLVLMVEFAGRRILLTGDLEIDGDQVLVSNLCDLGNPAHCPRLRADVLKVPHHGSARLDLQLLIAAHPDWAVISAGYRNLKDCLPRMESIDALHRAGAKVASTSAAGNENVVLTVQRTGAISWALPRSDIFAWRHGDGACKAAAAPQGL